MNRHLDRFSAVLFFLLPHSPCLAVDLTYSNEVYFSQGMPMPSYWAAHPLSANQSEKVWGRADKIYKAQQPIRDTNIDYFVERREQRVLTSNQTTLTLAALNRIPADFAVGSYPLNANVENYHFDTFGFNYHGLIPSSGVTFTISPKLVNLYNFNYGIGEGELQINNKNEGLLIGTLDRYSISSYGFDPKPNPLKIHTGFSSDIEVEKSTDQYRLNLIILNAFSRISVDNYFYNKRLYQVNTLNNELVFSDTPSLTGFYGQTTRTLHLPRIFQFQAQENSNIQGLSPMIGAQAYNSMVSPWLGVKYQSDILNFKLKTSDGANFYINSEFKNVFLKNLTAVFSMYISQYRKSEFLISNLTYKY